MTDSPIADCQPSRKVFRPLVFGIVIAVLFCVLTMIHLDSQGAYYDELHQAPAAFHYIGKHPVMFTREFFGVPTFNMTYSGAIKSAVYGLLLKYVIPHFTVYSWRLLGILFVAVGLLGFYWISGTSLPMQSAAIFGLLLLTDISVIVTTRHDWGPTALALALRLIFSGVWLSIEWKEPALYKYAVAGFIVGLAIFEKLSSVVLVLPLLALLLRSKKRKLYVWPACGAAFLAGMFPMLRANMHTYRTQQTLISLSDAFDGKRAIDLRGIWDYAIGYLSLGHGEFARYLVLGQPTNQFLIGSETLLMAVIVSMVLLFAMRERKHPAMHLAGMFAGIYIAVSVGLLLLPKSTSVHHWLIGTPFQYIAIAIAFPLLPVRRVFPAVALAALMAIRLPTLLSVESAFASGTSSVAFDPGFNRLGELAARQASAAVFIAADWGTGTQLYCGSNGEDDFVYETNSTESALQIADTTKKKTLFVIRSGLAEPGTTAFAAILDAIRKSPTWKEVPVEDGHGHFGPIELYKFIR